MPTPAPASPPAPARLASLDALRGFDMFWIVGADAIGGAIGRLHAGPVGATIAEQLDHVAWAGFRAYDLIFPLFVFMVGVAIPLSLSKYVAAGRPGDAVPRILRRTALLFVLGLFYYGGLTHAFSDLRLMGVLQRIGLCYGAASLLFLYCRPRAVFAVIAGLLLGYWALLAFVPVPGFGAGDYAEGHNLTNWLDAHVLPFRKWDGDHDPEGLLSTLPAIATCLLGVCAGRFLRESPLAGAAKAARLALAGVALLALGYAWGLEFPVIKKLWTSSFVLVAGGWSFLLLAGFYYTIDVRDRRGWAQPFVWVGANALTLYLVSNIVDFNALSARLAGGPVAAALDAVWTGLGGLILALVGAALCILLARFLYRRQIFLRL